MRDRLKLNAAASIFRCHQAWFWPSSLSAIVVFGGFVGVCALMVWLGEPAGEDRASNLGSVLEAQAAMTAIFLAAMIFIVEAVQRREGLDDPLYELFLSKSWVRWVFATAVWLLVVTALLYLFGPITTVLGELADDRGDALGISSLVLAAFLVLVFLLRALHVLRPEQYRAFRREAVLDHVRIGARTYAQSPESLDDKVRRVLGNLSETEAQGTRAIERVMDQACQAVERGQLTEIREDVALLEMICQSILDELEKSESASPEINSLYDRSWLGHDNLLAGLQRLVRAAANADANEATLRAIFHADTDKTGTYLVAPYRLLESVREGNELFLQVMLECIELEQGPVSRLTGLPLAYSFETPLAEMLSSTLRESLPSSTPTDGAAREYRMAHRIAVNIHKLAGAAALRGEINRAAGLLQAFVYQVDDAIRVGDDPLNSALRLAALSTIGFAVGTGNESLLEGTANSSLTRGFIDGTEASELRALIEMDANLRYEGESLLGGGLIWLTTAMRPTRTAIETASDVEQAQAESVVLGYMWLIGIVHVHGGIDDVQLPDTARPEFDRVWRLHGARLIAALKHADIGDSQDLRSWCEAAYGLDDQGQY